MLYCPCYLVAVETHFHVLPVKYKYFENFFQGLLLKIKFATSQQLPHSMFCKNFARLAVAKEHYRGVRHSYAP